MTRKSGYPQKIRKAALDPVPRSGRPIAEVFRSLAVSESRLWNWAKAAREAPRLDLRQPGQGRPANVGSPQGRRVLGLGTDGSM